MADVKIRILSENKAKAGVKSASDDMKQLMTSVISTAVDKDTVFRL